MKQASRQHSIFELVIIGLLITIACWPAATFSVTGLLPLFHAVFLLTGYLLARLIVGRQSKWIGKLIFAGAAVLLLADITAQHITGLHLNFFVISIMLQPGISDELGISGVGAAAGIMLLVGISLYGAHAMQKPAFILRGRILLVLGMSSAAIAQLLYGVLFFQGAAEVEDTRRKLPFFTAPHPYYSGKVLGVFLDKNSDNPFAIATSSAINTAPPAPSTSFMGTKKNVLMIVVDSLRSKDIALNPGLAPNLMSWAQKGTLSLNHYSVSNCTQFSFYSLFTGALPTGFGAARRGNNTLGMLPAFATNGYKISTAEANSLDWYDTAKIIFPSTTNRYISAENGTFARDKDVTNNTVATLAGRLKNGDPFFHLTYYFGPHYPYDPSMNAVGEANIDKYRQIIQTVDTEIGNLLKWVERNNLLNNTIVIVTADHGEEFQTTGRTGHASRLSDEQVQVPFLLIDQTGGAPALPPALGSHLDIAPYLLEKMTGATTYQPQAIALANCGYDYPTELALLTKVGRADFSHRGGYLTPIQGPNGEIAAKPLQLEAASQLLGSIKKGAAEEPLDQ